jgi:mannose-6-phosphate isomerase-like protein (cupin superfamily)
MFVSRSAMTVEQREKVRDGEGIITFTHCVEGKGAVQKNTAMFAEMVLPPGASVGYHTHQEETEFYVFLEGSGLVSDNGKEIPVKPGDTLITGDGASHSLTNNGTVPLKLLAAIIKD